MDNLKKNLHLVVFGAGVLLAIILMVVGIVIRGGTEGSLDAAQDNVKKASNPPTAGDLKLATAAREAFDTGIKDAEASMTTGRGAKLGLNPTDITDGGQFWTGSGKPALTELQAGFTALEKPIEVPKILSKFRLAPPQQEDFWGTMEREWSQLASDRARIREADRKIRIMREVLGAAQVVAARPEFASEGFKLIKFTFDTAPASAATALAAAPWLMTPFTLVAECSPAFSAALIDELSSPSTTQNDKRLYFPVLVDKVMTEMSPRPTGVEFTIPVEMREELKLSDKLNPDSQEGKAEADRIAKLMADEARVAIPPKLTAKFQALLVNRDWRVIKQAE